MPFCARNAACASMKSASAPRSRIGGRRRKMSKNPIAPSGSARYIARLSGPQSGAGARMLQGWVVVVVALGYIGLLFVIASYGDRKRGREGARLPLIYPL